METPTQPPRLTREKAHAIIRRLLTESMETRQKMEDEFHTDPGIQATLARLERGDQEKLVINEQP